MTVLTEAGTYRACKNLKAHSLSIYALSTAIKHHEVGDVVKSR